VDEMIPGMTTGMTARWRQIALSTALILVMNTNTFAGKNDDEEESLPDARLSGYPQVVQYSESNVLSWFAMVGLGAVCLGVLFKNAKRTHLD